MNIPNGIIIIGIILLIWDYYFMHGFTKYEKTNVHKLIEEKKLKTGDIILFKAHDNHNAPFIMSFFGHIGIVWVDPHSKVYNPLIFEAANVQGLLEENSKPTGIYLVPLYDRISKYNGATYYKELAIPIPANINANFGHFINYCRNTMTYNVKIFNNGLKKFLGEHIHHKINCGEIVYLSMIKLGLLPPEEFNSKIWHHLRWTCNVTSVYKNYYKKPLRLVYSSF